MMTRRVYRVVLLGMALVVLVVAGAWCQQRLNDLRTRHQLTETTVYENAPPTVAFVQVALGGFRGLLADFLFLRSQAMQEREDFFELVQLADWIVKLQPRFTGAITFLAWNMSYNVSVIFTDPRDRWRWVQRGIELIRDEALAYHPGDPDLYRELGWLYQHKVGQIMDDCNRYYKAQMALQLIEVLGNKRRYDWAELAAAPDSLEALKRQLGSQADALREAFARAGLTFARLEVEFRQARRFPEALASQFAGKDFSSALDLCLRRRWLQDVYKLDPVRVRDLIAKYGYLDFRLPEAHAVYWASLGLEHADHQRDIGCERMIFQAMKDAFVRGQLLYLTGDQDPDRRIPFMGPNLAVADSVRKAYLDAAANHPDNSSVLSGYENFMKDAIVLFYVSGRREKATEYLRLVRTDDRLPRRPEYRKAVDEFAISELAEDIAGRSTDQAQAIVSQLLVQANWNLALGVAERATGMEWMAAQVHRQYNAASATDARNKMRRGLPAFEVIRREVRKECLRSFHPELASRLADELRRSGVDVDALQRDISDEAGESKNLLDQPAPGELPIQRQ